MKFPSERESVLMHFSGRVWIRVGVSLFYVTTLVGFPPFPRTRQKIGSPQ